MPLVSIVMLATSRTSSSRWPFADSCDVLGHVGAVEDHRVGAAPALDGVAAFAGVPDERVVAASEVDRVVSSTRVDRVVSGVAANRFGARASDEAVVSASTLDRRRDGVGEDAVGLVDADGVVAGAGVDVDAGHVGADEVEDGRAVVEVDLQDARIAGLQAERDRVAVGCALDRQGAVFQLGLLEAVCRGVALRSDEPGQAREGGRGRRQSSQMVHVFLLSNVCRDRRGSDPSLAPWATPCLFGAAGNTGGSPRCERPPRRRTMDAMIDPRLRQLYNPQLADRNRLEARAARRVALGARRRYELELQRRPSLDDVRRPRAERRPRLAASPAVTVIAAVVVIAVVLAASGGALQRDCRKPPGRYRPVAVAVGEGTSTALVLDGPADAGTESRASEPLLERREETARIESALAEARSGHGAFVVVEGPAGIGKTALLGAARCAAADSGMRVLSARGTELERDFSFGVVRQLFEAVLVEADEDERANLLEADAGAAAGLLGLPGAPLVDGFSPARVDPSFAILHGLYWLCANLAAATPLCLVVDDAHWADAASLRFLAFLLTRLEELDVALVVATRPREDGTDAGLLATVTSDPSADVIHLPPLTRAAVARLVESRLGGTPDRVFVDALFRATKGTPFLVRELVEALSERDIPATAEAARQVERIGARTIGRSIRLRLRRLPEARGRLARALAILEQSDLLVAARLADLDEAEAADAAELLVTAGILESGRPLRFVHPIVRSGIYSELTTAERAQGHRTAARLLADRPGACECVAEHLLSTDPAADGWVVERLVGAARAAAGNGSPESAAVFLRRALDEPPPAADQHALLLELGTAEASAGLDGWVDHLQDAVATAPDSESAAGAAIVLAGTLNRAQRFAEAVDVLDRAASALDSRDSELALKLEAAAVVIGMSDPVTAPAIASRGGALRERAEVDPDSFSGAAREWRRSSRS